MTADGSESGRRRTEPRIPRGFVSRIRGDGARCYGIRKPLDGQLVHLLYGDGRCVRRGKDKYFLTRRQAVPAYGSPHRLLRGARFRPSPPARPHRGFEAAPFEEEVTWTVDMADGGAALLIALLVNHAQVCPTSRPNGQPGDQPSTRNADQHVPRSGTDAGADHQGAGRSRRAGQAAAGRHPAAVGRCVAVEDVDDRQLSRGPVIDPRAFRTVAARQALPRVIGCLGNESADAPDPGQ